MNFWPVSRGLTGLEQMEEENQGDNQLTQVYLENGIKMMHTCVLFTLYSLFTGVYWLHMSTVAHAFNNWISCIDILCEIFSTVYVFRIIVELSND